MKIEILDLGINNLNSVVSAVDQTKNVEDSLLITRFPSEMKSDSKLILLPGLGSFQSGSESLNSSGLSSYIHNSVENGSFVLGICLGMALLGNSSEESRGFLGLGIIEGESQKLRKDSGERIPHNGWSEVVPAKDSSRFPSLSLKKDFFFVHSYEFRPRCAEDVLTLTPFGATKFVSGVKKDRVIGFQFHPEKSSSIGRSLLKDVLDWSRVEN